MLDALQVVYKKLNVLRPPQPPSITHVHFPYQAEKQLRSFQWYQQYTPLLLRRGSVENQRVQQAPSR